MDTIIALFVFAHFSHPNHIIWDRNKAGFEITKNILSCDRARFRAWPKYFSCAIRARFVHEKNRAKNQHRAKIVLLEIQDNVEIFGKRVIIVALIYQFHQMEPFRAFFVTFAHENYHFWWKARSNFIWILENRARKKSCTKKFYRARIVKSCTIFFVISNPGMNQMFMVLIHLNIS